MRRLTDVIHPRARFVRSANVERDGDTSASASYTPTARSLDLVRRALTGWLEPRGRAWSVSGPYGSGKSSIALVLDALFARVNSAARSSAINVLDAVDPGISDSLASVHRLHGSEERGFIRAFVTADLEPATTTVLRAIDRGIKRYWERGRKPRIAESVQVAMAQARDGRPPTASQVIALVEDLCSHAPVMLVIDEFGKNLDFLREVPAEGDLFVMQSLAEASGGIDGWPLGVMTMQHMSFDDYSSSASGVQRREWAKVQGRFEDVLYLDSADQTIALMSRVFEVGYSKAEEARVRSWAETGMETIRELGLSDRIIDAQSLATMYPLHPLVAAVLPDLCRRYGQNERTLFSFLTHDEPGAVGEFLAAREFPASGDLPVVRLHDVFDYFVGSVTPSLGASPESARWFEIRDRIGQAVGLSQAETQVLKTVGVLNLIAQGGSLRASRSLLRNALHPAEWMRDQADLDRILSELEQRGFLTYRAFADEFRLWQGSDFDIEGRLELARRDYDDVMLDALIRRVSPLAPAVASRHGQEHGSIRRFSRMVLETEGVALDRLMQEVSDSDGLIAYWVGAGEPVVPPSIGLPVVLIRAPQLHSLRTALVDAAAAEDVLESGDLDWVARREMEERAALAAATVRAAVEAALNVNEQATLILNGRLALLPSVRSVSEMASCAADVAYGEAPRIRNEMLARSTLTSQAARARVELLAAMVTAPSEPQLGLVGYGPERSLYEAVLHSEGLHKFDGETWSFCPPMPESSYSPAWRLIDSTVRGKAKSPTVVSDIEAALRQPPIGMKPPVVPILLTAYLLSNTDQVAVYQDGTFQTRLTPDLLERLTKAPSRFSLRHLVVEGQRVAALRELAREFGLVISSSPSRRGMPVLSIVAPLLETVRQLPEYSLRVAPLSTKAGAVRSQLLEAREPDRLIFEDLPAALGLPTVDVDSTGGTISEYARTLHEAMSEIAGAYAALLASVSDELSEGLALHRRNSLRVEAAARTRPLLRQVAEPRLRSLLHALTSDSLDDNDWVEAVALSISERPPRIWRETDVERFPAVCSALLASFRRVEALHFDLRVDSPVGAIPRRITVTAPDGSESSTVVWIGEGDLPVLRSLLDGARRMFSEALPSLGDAAMLGALAESVLPRAEEEDVQSVDPNRSSREELVGN